MGALRCKTPLGPQIIEMYYGSSLRQVGLQSLHVVTLLISHNSVSLTENL